MPPHSFALTLHSGVNVRLAFILGDGHDRAVLLAFGIEADTAPITSRERECCKNGSGGKEDLHTVTSGQMDAAKLADLHVSRHNSRPVSIKRSALTKASGA